MVLNTQETLPPRLTDAADGRFFYAHEAGESLSPFGFSGDFWLRHLDLLPEGHGVVLQAYMDEAGQLSGTETQASPNYSVVSLFFDTRKKDTKEFDWHVVIAKPGEGRTATNFHVGSAMVEVTKSDFDSSGKKKAYATGPDVNFNDVMLLATHDLVRLKAVELRARRDSSERELESFAITGLARYSPNRYVSETDKRLKRIDSIGFIALSPGKIS